jgi:hypothetical protein
MPLVWDWLEKADFVHNITEGGEVFNVWRYHTGGTSPPPVRRREHSETRRVVSPSSPLSRCPS